MAEPCANCHAETEEWWNYCAECGYHIAYYGPGPVKVPAVEPLKPIEPLPSSRSDEAHG